MKKPVGRNRSYRLFGALASLMLLMSGCVLTKEASVKQEDGGRTLFVQRMAKGILLGPCSTPYVGSVAESAWISLKGPGPVYSASEVELVDAKGIPLKGRGKLDGDVRFDLARKRVTVKLRVADEDFWMNGSFRYKESG